MKMKQIIIPEVWAEIPIRDFQDYQNLKLDGMSDLDVMLNTVNVFCQVDKRDILRMPYADLLDVFKIITKVLTQDATPPLKHLFVLDGFEYGFHPCLKDITTGEFADLEEFFKSGTWDNMHKIMAVLYREVTRKDGDKYNIADYTVKGFQDRAELFREKLGLDIVLGASVFFWNLGQELLDVTQASLSQDLKNLQDEYSKTKPN